MVVFHRRKMESSSGGDRRYSGTCENCCQAGTSQCRLRNRTTLSGRSPRNLRTTSTMRITYSTESEEQIGRLRSIVFAGKSILLNDNTRLTREKGRLHDQLRLHHLTTSSLGGALRCDLRLVSRLEVLSRAREVRTANARGLAVSHDGREVGLGPRTARSSVEPGLAEGGDERSVGSREDFEAVMKNSIASWRFSFNPSSWRAKTAILRKLRA